VVPLQALGAVPAAVVMAAALLGAGSRLRRWLRVAVRPTLRLVLDWSFGSLALAAVVLVLGVLQLWSAWTLGAVVAGGIALGAWRRSRYRWLALVPPALGAGVALPVALAAPFFYDALVYHLGLPWQAIAEHGLRAHAEDVFSAFPPLVQFLYAPLLALGLDRAPAVLHLGGFVAAGCAVTALARVLGAPRWAAASAALTFLLLPGHALVPGLPAAEGWADAAIVAALAVVLSPRLPPGGAVTAGSLVGIATAARLQGIPWTAIVLAVLWVRAPRRGTVARGLAGWLVGSAPWWAKNLLLLGDPIAPVLWRREGMATLLRDAGSFLSSSAPRGVAGGLPGALAPHAAYLLPLILGAVLAVVPRGAGRCRLGGAAAVAGALAWAATGSLPRFLAPTLAVVVALAAAAARTLVSRWAAGLALATAAAIGLAFDLGELHRVGGVTIVSESGAGPSRWVDNDPRPAFVAARTLPSQARVLFVGEARGFGFPRRFAMPSQHDVSPLRAVLETARSPREAAAALRANGFTHLLVNWSELARLAPAYPVAPWRNAVGWRRWSSFVASCGAPVVRAGTVEVFAVPEGAGPAV